MIVRSVFKSVLTRRFVRYASRKRSFDTSSKSIPPAPKSTASSDTSSTFTANSWLPKASSVIKITVLVFTFTLCGYTTAKMIKEFSTKGEPKSRDILVVSRLNDKLMSYRYEMIAEAEGVEAARKFAANELIGRRLGRRVKDLSVDQINKIRSLQATYLSKSLKISSNQMQNAANYTNAVIKMTAHPTMKSDKDEDGKERKEGKEVDLEAQKATIVKHTQELAGDWNNKMACDLQFLLDVLAVLTPEQREQLLSSIEVPLDETTQSQTSALLNHYYRRHSLTPSEASAFLSALSEARLLELLCPRTKPHVYLINFNGDSTASQVAHLREEITAVLSSASPSRGDSVVLMLTSGGGTVTGYGLAAAELQRVKDGGLKLTVCVDEIAASGGYLMAAVADKIIASPFAVLGSIGVVSMAANFSERLAREGVSVDDVTAGKYKRTLTPYKKPTAADRAKRQEELEDVHGLFKAFLKQQRPGMDVESLSTGETWYGPEALQRGLCDVLSTGDDVIMKLREEGAEIFTVEHRFRSPRTIGSLLDEGPWESVGLMVRSIILDLFKAWLIQQPMDQLWDPSPRRSNQETDRFLRQILAVSPPHL